jgi:hypothetical protein
MLALGLPAGLLTGFVYLFFVIICEVAKKSTSSINKGEVANMTKLLKSIREALKDVCKSLCDFFRATVWAVGAEVAAANGWLS